MRFPFPCCLRVFLAVLAIAAPSTAMAGESATASITVTAEFATRTSLKVSSQVLQFDLDNPDQPGLAAIDFAVGARTRIGGEVVLTVEPVRSVVGPEGAADILTSVTFSGTGLGTLAGALQESGTTVAGRWNGSGLRTGRLTFALRAPVSGSYTLPVRFVLSTP